MVTIARSNVIGGAEADPFHVGTVHHCGGGILERTTVLVAAQLHDIRADPRPVLVPPPSGGLRLAVFGVYFSKATGAYTGGGALTINHTSSANTLVGTINHGDLTAAAARSGWAILPALTGTASTFALPDDGLDINSSGDFSGAGGDLTIVVRYVEVG